MLFCEYVIVRTAIMRTQNLPPVRPDPAMENLSRALAELATTVSEMSAEAEKSSQAERAYVSRQRDQHIG